MRLSDPQADIRSAIHGMWADVAAAWSSYADDVDDRAASMTRHMLDQVNLRPGQRVLELACGPGGAGLAAAERVGASGEVVISDVVPAMVEIAHQRAISRAFPHVSPKVLDLENIAEPDGGYDVVLCREGMMFALEPARAAREMYRVLRPTGRVAIGVWAAKEANPWLNVLFEAIFAVTGKVVPPPGRPGPFALADEEQLVRLFTEAGFADVTLERVAAPLRCPSTEAWWSRTRAVAGPVVAVLRSLDADTLARLEEAVRVAVSAYEVDGRLELPGLALVLTARHE